MEQRLKVDVAKEMTPDPRVGEDSPGMEKGVQAHRVERMWLVWGTQEFCKDWREGSE